MTASSVAPPAAWHSTVDLVPELRALVLDLALVGAYCPSRWYVRLLQNCPQLPLELSGTVGVSSTGVNRIKASYSNYGSLFVQVSAACLCAMCVLT